MKIYLKSIGFVAAGGVFVLHEFEDTSLNLASLGESLAKAIAAAIGENGLRITSGTATIPLATFNLTIGVVGDHVDALKARTRERSVTELHKTGHLPPPGRATGPCQGCKDKSVPQTLPTPRPPVKAQENV